MLRYTHVFFDGEESETSSGRYTRFVLPDILVGVGLLDRS